MAAGGEKRLFIVETHFGKEETWAVSAAKAIQNVRWRVFGRCSDSATVKYWTAREAAAM